MILILKTAAVSLAFELLDSDVMYQEISNKIPALAFAELLRVVMKNFDLVQGKDRTFNLIRHRYALACNLALNIHYVIREISADAYIPCINEGPDKFYAPGYGAVETISQRGIFTAVITVN